MQSTEYNKIVFGGSVGAGKSTAIAAISDTPPISTEETLSDGPIDEKTTTTVALDYSFVNIDGEIVHLYGLPGQTRLAFMRNILLEGAFGAVLLLKATDPRIYEHAHEWLSSLLSISPSLKIAIGITHTERSSSFSMVDLRGAVARVSPMVPMLSIDARQREDVQQLIKVLLALHLSQP